MNRNHFFKRSFIAFLLAVCLIACGACGTKSASTANEVNNDNLQSNLIDSFHKAIDKLGIDIEDTATNSTDDKEKNSKASDNDKQSNDKNNSDNNNKVPQVVEEPVKQEEVKVQPEEPAINTHQTAQVNATSSNEIAQELAALTTDNTPSLAMDIDDSQLSPKDQAIMAIVRPVVMNIMSTYSTAVEREKAAHDYIVQNCDYDYARYNAGTLEDDDFSIYGCVVNHVCVCAGYAQTFKLFMDLMGIPCDYVRGVACNGDNHAWNAVQLDGQWYQVDVTWDDQPGCYGGVDYSYFNVTDAYMKQTHSYSYQNACTATQYSFENIAKTWSNYCATIDDYYSYVEKMVSQGNIRFPLYVTSSISNLKDYVVAARIPNRPEGYRFHAYMISFNGEPNSKTPGIMMIYITEYGGEM